MDVQYIILVQFIAGFFLLIKGSDYLVNFAIDLSNKFHLSGLFVGFAIVSIGTSLPELAVALASNVNSNTADATRFVFSIVVGSNLANMTFILGTALCFGAIKLSNNYWQDLLICFIGWLIFHFASFSFLDMGGTSLDESGTREVSGWISSVLYSQKIHLELSRWEGIFFVLFLFSYLGLLFYRGRKKETNQSEGGHKKVDRIAKTENPDLVKRSDLKDGDEGAHPKPVRLFKGVSGILWNFFLLSLSVLAISWGADWIVKGASYIALDLLGIQEKIVVICTVALGTSLPELSASVISVKKKQSEILLGNVLGSCLFNMFFITGLASLIRPFELNEKGLLGSFYFDNVIFVFLLFSFFVVGLSFGRRLPWFYGVFLLCFYGGYVFYLFST